MSKSLYDIPVRSIAPGHWSPLDVPACPVCDHMSAAPTFEIEGLRSRVVTCLGCGLGRLHPMPDSAEIGSFYPQEYYGDSGEKFESLVELMVRVVAARHTRFLVRGLPAGARVLDIGCGRGVLLRTLADRGFEAHGVERSALAVQGADPRAHIRIADRLADAKYDQHYFDHVILWHVLEHLPDPRETFEEIHRILKPGGRFVVAVPNFSSLQARWAGAAWFHLDLPRHLYHFPLPALRRLLERCGFTGQREHHFSLRQNPFGWVQSALNRLAWLPRNGLYELLHVHAERDGPPFDWLTRLQLRTAYYLGMPAGLALSLLATALRNGATVHVVAKSNP